MYCVYTCINVLMCSILSLYQYETRISGQILHTETSNVKSEENMYVECQPFYMSRLASLVFVIFHTLCVSWLARNEKKHTKKKGCEGQTFIIGPLKYFHS